jgi:putative ABC transport system ATP-binding protein
MIELKNINKVYQPKDTPVPVLHDITLTVEKGDYLAIMGPSGSGKSTLMNIIGCLDTPTSGTYEFDGTDILSLSDNKLAELRAKKIGFVFQNFELLPGETALQNVMLPLSFSGTPRKERKDIATAALEKVGLGERLDHRPSQLSGGQKQRVAIARSLINHPDMLLADEPTGALDQKSGRDIMDLFDSLNHEGITIVMITHDPNIAKRARKIVYIVDGHIYDDPTLIGKEDA